MLRRTSGSEREDVLEGPIRRHDG